MNIYEAIGFVKVAERGGWVNVVHEDAAERERMFEVLEATAREYTDAHLSGGFSRVTEQGFLRVGPLGCVQVADPRTMNFVSDEEIANYGADIPDGVREKNFVVDYPGADDLLEKVNDYFESFSQLIAAAGCEVDLAVASDEAVHAERVRLLKRLDEIDARLNPAPRLAETVEVYRDASRARKFSLKIDGREFPWHVNEGVSTRVDNAELPSVSIEIPADYVSVVDEWPSKKVDD